MKSWKETSDILRRVVRLSEEGRRSALATVVRVEGSAYRRAGAKLLVEADGATLGSISGGCLEADVREAALGVLRESTPRRLHYDTGAGDEVWGLGLGCRGSVDIFVQPADDPGTREAAARAVELFAGTAPFAMSTIVRGAGRSGLVQVVGSEGIVCGSTGDAELDRALALHAAGRVAGGGSTLETLGVFEVFTDVLAPAPHLLLCGADDDAIPICRYASEAGFRVLVADHRPALLSEARFPEANRRIVIRPEEGSGALSIGPSTQAVVKTHSLVLDREWVRRLLSAGAGYVAVLGPRARTEDILRQIGAQGDERVFGPAGLDLGAEGPEQVALSIVAELLAVRGARRPRHLRDKESAIHAATA